MQMNSRRFADEIPENVVAYCEAIEVPDFDEAAFASLHPVRVRQSERWRGRLKLAASVAAMVALLVVFRNIPAVIAGVQRAFSAFTFAAGRTTPLTIRAVGLERARADMPFTVIAPPAIKDAPVVRVDEMYANASLSDGSVIFEIHGAVAGAEVMIVESKAANYHVPTLFAIRGPAGSIGLPGMHSLDSPGPFGRRRSTQSVLRGSLGGRKFVPASWVVRGTRVVVMSPPGFLSSEQLQALRRAMSR